MPLLRYLLIAVISQMAVDSPPKFFIDVSVCPGLFCHYGEWKARQDIVLYANKNITSKVITKISRDEMVNAITGDVHTIPGKVKILKAFTQDQNIKLVKNNNLFVYTYIDEDTYSGGLCYKVWYKGKMVVINLGEDQDTDYVKWLRKPTSVWWVKIKTKAGLVGWTNSQEFDGRYLPY